MSVRNWFYRRKFLVFKFWFKIIWFVFFINNNWFTKRKGKPNEIIAKRTDKSTKKLRNDKINIHSLKVVVTKSYMHKPSDYYIQEGYYTNC